VRVQPVEGVRKASGVGVGVMVGTENVGVETRGQVLLNLCAGAVSVVCEGEDTHVSPQEQRRSQKLSARAK
jgi:hypothetical protein